MKKNIIDTSNEDAKTKNLERAYDILDIVCEEIRKDTEDCIYKDDKYFKLVACAAEFISAIYLLSEDKFHTFQYVSEKLIDNIDRSVNEDKEPKKDT